MVFQCLEKQSVFFFGVEIVTAVDYYPWSATGRAVKTPSELMRPHDANKVFWLLCFGVSHDTLLLPMTSFCFFI